MDVTFTKLSADQNSAPENPVSVAEISFGRRISFICSPRIEPMALFFMPTTESHQNVNKLASNRPTKMPNQLLCQPVVQFHTDDLHATYHKPLQLCYLPQASPQFTPLASK